MDGRRPRHNTIRLSTPFEKDRKYETGATLFPISLRPFHMMKFLIITVTVEFQRLGRLWNHKNMFETRVVRANEC